MKELEFVFLEHEEWPEWFTLNFLPATANVQNATVAAIDNNNGIAFVAEGRA